MIENNTYTYQDFYLNQLESFLALKLFLQKYFKKIYTNVFLEKINDLSI